MDRSEVDLRIRAARRLLRRPTGADVQWVLQFELATAYRERYLTSGATADANAVVRAMRAAVAACPPGHPDRHLVLVNASASLRIRFGAGGRPSDIDEAIAFGRQALAAAPHEGTTHAQLAVSLAARFGESRNHEDLDEAAGLAREAASTCGTVDAGTAGALASAAQVLVAAAEVSASVIDAGEAAALAGRVASAHRDGRVHLPMAVVVHGQAALLMARLAEDAPAMEAAVELLRAGQASLPTCSPDRLTASEALAAALQERFLTAGGAAHLRELIAVRQEIIERRGQTGPGKLVMASLAVDLSRMYAMTGEPGWTDQAIATARRAALDPFHRMNLATMLGGRYDTSGRDEDLDEALRLMAEPAGGNDTGPVYLNRSFLLQMMFRRTGQVTYLHQAIDQARRAVRSSAGSDLAGLAWHSLNINLRLRYIQTGEVRDLDDAVEAGRQAVQAGAPHSTLRGRPAGSLSATLLARYEVTTQAGDLDEAITRGRQAVLAGADEPAYQPLHLITLSSALLQRGRDRMDLDEAAAAAAEAVTALSAEHGFGLQTALTAVGRIAARRYRLGGDLADLDRAVDAFRQARQLQSASWPYRAALVRLSAEAHFTRAQATDDRAELDEAVSLWHDLSLADDVSAQHRIAGASAIAGVFAANAMWPRAHVCYAYAVGLLPLLAWSGLSRRAQEHRLAGASGLATEASSCAVAGGDPAEAVTLSEHGRGLLWTQLLQSRSDTSRLERTAPELAARLRAASVARAALAEAAELT